MAVPTLPRVPFVDLAAQHRAVREELLAAVAQVIESGQFILGPQVQEFEQRFAELCGVRHAVGVNSGTDAICLALRALDIGPGDDVLTVPNSFVATASAIALCGARPVLVDVRDDYNMDPGQIVQAITPRTRAILPVHLTGRPADMQAISEIAQAHNLHVVEDAAQAVAAEYRGRRVGSLGTIGCFSLHPLKTLSACGDGGMLTTDDEGLASRLRVLRNIGLQTRDDAVQWSGNSRLDTIQAAMLLVKLRYLDTWTDARRAHAEYYRTALAGTPGIRVPLDQPHERAVYHTFVIQAERRDKLKQFLAERGIDTAIHYPRLIHLQTAARGLNLPSGSFPVAEAQAGRILSLPVYAELTSQQRAAVVDAIRAFAYQ